MSTTLLVSKKDEPLKYSVEIKTTLTMNLNSVIVNFNKEPKSFYVKIGSEEILMLPSELRELIDVFKEFYKTVEKYYLK